MRKIRKLFVICLLMALAPVAANAAPSFVNSGFESDSWSVGTTDQITPIGWNAIQSSDSRFIEGVHNTGSTTSQYTPYGLQFIELCAQDCFNRTIGNVSQTISGFTPGNQYVLQFEHSPESTGEHDLVQVQIAGGGTISNVFDGYVSSGNGGWSDWVHHTWTFTANSSTLTFTFSGYVDPNDGVSNYESGIDNITLSDAGAAPSSIPTLTEWGTILLSILLALGAVFTLHCRRQS
jgi:hypothetical protein